MTNEQIEKHFIFDLEMETFKKDEEYIEFSECGQYKKILTNILLKFGYKNMSNTIFISIREAKFLKDILIIDPKIKEFKWDFIDSDLLALYTNKCPEYLKEYKL